MPSKHVMTTRWSDFQYALLLKLQKKLGLSLNDILRLAVARLAEAEGLLVMPKK